jgi:hypothetical protein
MQLFLGPGVASATSMPAFRTLHSTVQRGQRGSGVAGGVCLCCLESALRGQKEPGATWAVRGPAPHTHNINTAFGMAAMCGLLETGTSDEGRQRAEAMARASCLVPSLMATPVAAKVTTALSILVGWATLETKRPYPLDTVGRGVGRDKANTTLAWRRGKVNVLVSWSPGDGRADRSMTHRGEFGQTVGALEKVVAEAGALDATPGVTPGGGGGGTRMQSRSWRRACRLAGWGGQSKARRKCGSDYGRCQTAGGMGCRLAQITHWRW